MMKSVTDPPRINQTETGGDDSRRHRFTRDMRLRKKRDFELVYQAAVRARVGPLLVYARPNGLAISRLGLAIARRVGPAVKRHRLKRLLRESFRRLQYDLPTGYDFLISAQHHELVSLDEYQRLFLQAASELDRKWRKKQNT